MATPAESKKPGARRSLAKDLQQHHSNNINHLAETYSPRLFTRKQLLLLQQQQQRQYQFADEPIKQPNLLNSRRVYPTNRSHQQLLLRNGEILSSDGSTHGSPLLPRNRVPKKMVVDEKQLAMKLLRARNALACSSSSASSSSSSSENPSLRASAEVVEFPARSSTSDLARRSFLSGCVSKLQASGAIQQRVVSSSGLRRAGLGTDSADEKKISSCVVGCSGRSSDAEDFARAVGYGRNSVSRHPAPAVPVLLRSASCSSASSSSLSKLVRLKAADMAPGMQEHAFFCANEVLEAMDKLHCKRVAWALKKEFDKAYGPAWHCVVGTSFGSYVTHSVGGFLYFSIGKVSVLLFQTAVELIEHH